MPINLKGTFTALIHPFSEGEIDFQGLKENIHEQMRAGIDGLVVLGTTGEAPALTEEESVRSIKTIIHEVRGNLPVIVGAGSYSTQKTIKLVERARTLGADAALLILPYYNKPTQEGLIAHFKAIHQATSIPLILYNHPGRTGVCLSLKSLIELSQLPRIIGIKEASTDAAFLVEQIHTLQAIDPEFYLLSGNDSAALSMIAVGAHGVVSVISNLVPQKMHLMTKAALKGDFQEAQSIHNELMPLMLASCLEGNPAAIKSAMELCGKASGSPRLPLTPLTIPSKEHLKSVLSSMNLLVDSHALV